MTVSDIQTFLIKSGVVDDYSTEWDLDLIHIAYQFDKLRRQTRYEGYSADGAMYGYWISVYNEDGELIQETMYAPETNKAIRYSTFE